MAVTDPVVKYFDKSYMPVHFYIVLVLNIIILYVTQAVRKALCDKIYILVNAWYLFISLY